jgi:putative ABC transport system permease protein
VEMHDAKVPVFLVGWQPGQHGGPWEMAEGRAPASDDEIAVGQVLAQRHGVTVGAQIDLLGRSFTVVGVARGADMFMASFVFMTHAATDQVLQAPDTTSFVLVGTDHPDQVRTRLATTGLAVLDRNELRTNDLAVMTRAFSTPIRLMVAVAFGVGSLVIALSAYSAIIDRRREYGIVKALGASRARLYRLALSQTLILALIGLAAGAMMFFGVRELITVLRPQFTIVLTVTIVARAVAAALAMGFVAAVMPSRRLARLDPATAYRGG